MDDFLGSVAQEDVQFSTGITRSAITGDNYMHLVVFCENTRCIADPTALVNANAGGTVKYAEVTADTYAKVTQGKVKEWLADYFAEQNNYSAFVVTFTDDLTADVDWTSTKEEDLADAFELFKHRAYFKTIVVGAESAASVTLPAAAVTLSELVGADSLLSAPILLPVTTPETPDTDPLYAALHAAEADAYMVAHSDLTRNVALYTLSMALSVLNASGLPVGNNFDFVGSTKLTPSGASGAALTVTQQTELKNRNIAYCKPIGDSTGQVIVYGAKSLNGEVIPAYWIVRYCNYRCKTAVANYIVRMNTYRNNAAYQGILSIMNSIVNMFTQNGSGRLANYAVTAPLFNALPAGGTSIIVPNAWTATYVDNVRSVQVSGSLEIMEG